MIRSRSAVCYSGLFGTPVSVLACRPGGRSSRSSPECVSFPQCQDGAIRSVERRVCPIMASHSSISLYYGRMADNTSAIRPALARLGTLCSISAVAPKEEYEAQRANAAVNASRRIASSAPLRRGLCRRFSGLSRRGSAGRRVPARNGCGGWWGRVALQTGLWGCRLRTSNRRP